MTGPDSISQHVLHTAEYRSNLESQINMTLSQDMETHCPKEKKKRLKYAITMIYRNISVTE